MVPSSPSFVCVCVCVCVCCVCCVCVCVCVCVSYHGNVPGGGRKSTHPISMFDVSVSNTHCDCTDDDRDAAEQSLLENGKSTLIYTHVMLSAT
jgi:hypothetical protein